MKTKTLLTTLILSAVCQFAPQSSRAQDMDSFAPVVVKTVPEAGNKEVSPVEFEVRITFSKEMTDQSWSWASAWQGSEPKSLDKPHYEADHKTCVMKVKLEPGKTYGWWINSPKFHGFQDTQNHPALPYFLTFRTKSN